MTVPTPGDPQAGTPPAAPQAGDPQTPQPQAGNGQTPGLTLEEALAELKKVRTEAASHRVKLTAFEKAEEERKLAAMGDLEKAAQRAEAAEAQARTYRERIALLSVQAEATKLGIVDPEVAAALIKDKLELDDDGAPKNADALLRELVKAKPYLLAQQQPGQQVTASTRATNPARTSTQGTTLTREAIDAMSQQERISRLPEIREWLSKQSQ